MALISEVYRGKVYAGDTPLESSLVIEQTGPLQITVRAGHLQTTGQARIVHKGQLRQNQINTLLASGGGEEMPPTRARSIPVAELPAEELSDLRRMGKVVRQETGYLALLSGVGAASVVVRESDLSEAQRGLGQAVEIPDDRLRVWYSEKSKRHDLAEFVWGVRAPVDEPVSLWLMVGTNPSGQSDYYTGQGDPVQPAGWSDTQIIVFPFALNPDDDQLPDVMVLTVEPGFPQNEI
jgi:hypothetical protein